MYSEAWILFPELTLTGIGQSGSHDHSNLACKSPIRPEGEQTKSRNHIMTYPGIVSETARTLLLFSLCLPAAFSNPWSLSELRTLSKSLMNPLRLRLDRNSAQTLYFKFSETLLFISRKKKFFFKFPHSLCCPVDSVSSSVFFRTSEFPVGLLLLVPGVQVLLRTDSSNDCSVPRHTLSV